MHSSAVVTQADVRRIALSLPDTQEVEGRFDLRLLIEDAWRCKAPAELAKRRAAKGK